MKFRVVLVVVLLVFVSTPLFAQGRCSLAGTWTGENDAGLVFLITMTPLDNAHRTFSSIADADVNPPGAVFPGATEVGTFHGELVRTGKRSFNQTALAYVRNDDGWIGTLAVSGTWTLSKDCGTVEVLWYASGFLPGDDPFASPPIFCLGPITGVYHHIPVVPSSCEE